MTGPRAHVSSRSSNESHRLTSSHNVTRWTDGARTQHDAVNQARARILFALTLASIEPIVGTVPSEGRLSLSELSRPTSAPRYTNPASEEVKSDRHNWSVPSSLCIFFLLRKQPRAPTASPMTSFEEEEERGDRSAAGCMQTAGRASPFFSPR
ncbi:hypothetical protein MRX96_012201 [Rhipicephalus microplus]